MRGRPTICSLPPGRFDKLSSLIHENIYTDGMIGNREEGRIGKSKKGRIGKRDNGMIGK